MPDHRPPPKRHREFITALARGLEVIQAFTADQPEMTLSEVAARTGLSPATVRRCLLTLQMLGYVGTVGRRFVLRPKILSLGSAFLISMKIKEVVQPYLQDLGDEFRDAASLVVLDDGDIVYVAHTPSKHLKGFRGAIGHRTPAHATSLGHVLLAHLDRIALNAYLSRAPFPKYTARTFSSAAELRKAFQVTTKQDYAAVRDQFEYGVLGIAVPVRSSEGQVVAAIGCSAETNRVEMESFVKTRLPRLRDVARELSHTLERSPALIHSILSVSYA